MSKDFQSISILVKIQFQVLNDCKLHKTKSNILKIIKFKIWKIYESIKTILYVSNIYQTLLIIIYYIHKKLVINYD